MSDERNGARDDAVLTILGRWGCDDPTPPNARWGLDWHGTAELLTLAEERGWKLDSLKLALDLTGAAVGYICILDLNPKGFVCDATITESGETEHLAVLFAVAEAARRDG